MPKENVFDYNDAMLEAVIDQAVAAERERYAKMLRQKDEAMATLFGLLDKAGVDYSHLIS